MANTYGAAGRMAAAFIHSKLTPLFIVAAPHLDIGWYAGRVRVLQRVQHHFVHEQAERAQALGR